MQVITWADELGDGVYIGGETPNDIKLTPHKTMTNTTNQEQFIAEVTDEELSMEELNDVNGSWGILTPVVVSFGAGYAAGTAFGKLTGLID